MNKLTHLQLLSGILWGFETSFCKLSQPCKNYPCFQKMMQLSNLMCIMLLVLLTKTSRIKVGKQLEIAVDIRYLECPLSRTFTVSNFFFGPFSSFSNSPYNHIRYLKPHYLELLLCQTNFSVPSALLSRYLELFHLDVRFLKKTVQKLWDSIECLSFCVHL